MKPITLEKKHEGTTIIALPTGNNERGKEGKLEYFVVEKVARKYATLRMVGYRYNDKYDRTTGATASCIRSGYGNNAGYKFFESMEDVNAYNEFVERLNGLRRFFSQFNWQNQLTVDQINRIAAIVQEINQ